MRNLKALGLALVAAFAMSAMFAVAAQAKDEGHIVSAKDTKTHETSFVTATDEFEENTLEFTVGESDVVHCDVNEFHGEIAGGTTKSLTLETTFGGTPATQNCNASGFPATVTNNGCHLRFYTAETDGGNWKVTTDLECPVKPIEVHAYAGGAHGFTVCTITVPSQSGLEGVTIDNNKGATIETEDKTHHTTVDDLTATVDVKGIHETQHGLCGTSETDEAEMHGEVTVDAENEAGEAIDLFVEHTIPPKG